MDIGMKGMERLAEYEQGWHRGNGVTERRADGRAGGKARACASKASA